MLSTVSSFCRTTFLESRVNTKMSRRTVHLSQENKTQRPQPGVSEKGIVWCPILALFLTFSVIGSRRTARSSNCLTGWYGVTRTKKKANIRIQNTQSYDNLAIDCRTTRIIRGYSSSFSMGETRTTTDKRVKKTVLRSNLHLPRLHLPTAKTARLKILFMVCD